MRCTRCVLPSTTPGISFDEHGVCSYCRNSEPIRYLGEPALLELLEKFKSAGRYDCIVNISGGRDSSFTILKAVRDYGLKVLALNYRNPLTHPAARANIANIRKKLGVDFIEFELAGNMHLRGLANNLSAWIRHPSPAMIPMMCVACKTIWSRILRIAHQNGIRFIFSGGNLLEQSGFKRELLGVSAEASVHKYYTNYVFGILREFGTNPRYLSIESALPALVGYFYANAYAPMARIAGAGLAKIDLFHYYPWNETEVLSRIRSELGWQSPEEDPSTWRFDCRIGHLKDYLYRNTLGLTEKDDFYSRMIREGLITRGQVLKRLELENDVNLESVKKLLAEVSIPFERLERSVEEYRNRKR